MIHIVLGTKAQLIKMAPIMRDLQRKGLAFRYISTGQHKETIEDLLVNFGLDGPHVVLYEGKDIVAVKAMFFWFLRLLMISLFKKKKVFGEQRKKSDIVLVHGDTLSTLLGALMGRLAGLKVGHVESGLRSFNLFHPFPEEITRILTFRLSHYLFCPDDVAVENLGYIKGIKVNTRGNTLYDSLKMAKQEKPDCVISGAFRPYCVVTLHRYENFNNQASISRILKLLEMASEKIDLVFVLHKPTVEALKKHDLYERISSNENIEMVPRMDYFSFISLIKNSDFVISDGGSNQEECFYLGKPVLLFREASERREGLGENCVISHYNEVIVENFLNSYSEYERPSYEMPSSPSSLIVDFCERNTKAI
jgi:UDP-N-acetylglucosamine 2-epimerase (non-hydrolysing)